MENASKALIVAASILLAIMVVSLGVTIFNKAQSSADSTDLDTTEINMFNQKFERYSGDQLGSQVKSLMSFAISNYSTNKEEPSKLPKISLKDEKDASNKINDGPGDDKDTFSTIRNHLVSTGTYNVLISYGNSGLISTITITRK